MRDYIHNQQPVLYAGVHQAESWGMSLFDEDAGIVLTNETQFGEAVVTDEMGFTTHGTDVVARIKGSGYFYAWTTDGLETMSGIFVPDVEIYNQFERENDAWLLAINVPSDVTAIGDGWFELILARSLLPETHSISVYTFLADSFQIDSITVLDRTFENVFPLAAGATIALGMTLWVVASALRARRELKVKS